jgi:hypothetical protein
MKSIPTTKRGRPRHIKTLAVSLIGSAGVSALQDNDLFIISGDLARELALIIGESIPTPTTQDETPSTPVTDVVPE